MIKEKKINCQPNPKTGTLCLAGSIHDPGMWILTVQVPPLCELWLLALVVSYRSDYRPC